MQKLEIVIPTYNRPEQIKKTLNSLNNIQTDVSFDVTVVDDSQNEDTKDVVQDSALNITYIRPEESINLPHARNVAIENSDAEIIAFVDDDVRFFDYWPEKILEKFSENESLGAAGGPALEYEQNSQTVLRSNKKENRITEKGFVQDKSAFWIPEKDVEVDTLRGANMAFRRKALEEIGGFDEQYIENSFREDTDVCVRIQRAGCRIIYSSDLKVRHLLAEEGGCRGREQWKALGQNQRHFIKKNYPEYWTEHLARFFLTWSYPPYSIWKLTATTAKNLEPSRLNYLRGFLSRAEDL